MNGTELKMVRVYLTEGDKLLKTLMNYLHNEVKVKGVTVFRAISGFGKSGVMHSNTLLEMSLDLPLAIEFFDSPEKVEPMLEKLTQLVGNGHVVCWNAQGY